MIEYPTPTPFPDLGTTPFPTLEGNIARDVSTGAVQWWNQADSVGFIDPLQVLTVIIVLMIAIALISRALKSVE